jgi:hypothetical protein
MGALKLTDAQMAAVMDAARCLHPRDRDAFVRLIADRLRDLPDPGPGDINAAVRMALEAMGDRRLRWVS